MRIATDTWRGGLDPYRDPRPEVAERAWIFGDGLVGVSERGIVARVAQRVPTRENGDISADQKTIVYAIRNDRSWHDGKRLVAADVVAAFHRLLESHPAWKSTAPYSNVAAIDALDATHVRVRLREADPSFIRLFFSAYGSVAVPLLRIAGGTLVGTSPWRIASTQPDRVILELAHGAHASITRINVLTFSDQTSAALALRSGDLDAVVPIDRAVARSENLHTIARQTGVVYIVANTQGALKDAPTREAVLSAIDTRTIAQRLFEGRETDVLFPGVRLDLPRNASHTRLPKIDFAFAKVPAMERIALLAQDSLQRHGIDVTLHGWPPSGYDEALRLGHFDLAVSGAEYTVAGDVAQELSCAYQAPHGKNVSRLCDPELDRAFAHQDLDAIATRLTHDAALRTVAEYFQLAAYRAGLHIPTPTAYTPWFADLANWTLS